MDTEIYEKTKVHHGRNMRRIREIMGVKQETIADALNITQPAVHKLEQKEKIDDENLSKIAEVLKVPVHAIKNYEDEATLSFIANTFQDSSSVNNYNYGCTFNPIDKIIELYERMLEMEREKNRK